jgi:hypothetical protein
MAGRGHLFFEARIVSHAADKASYKRRGSQHQPCVVLLLANDEDSPKSSTPLPLIEMRIQCSAISLAAAHINCS